jgi:Protein of unknown function (DUF4435)
MSNEIPMLTVNDKINAYNFFDDNKPAIVVEGESDKFIYEKILNELDFDWENIDIIYSGSKSYIRENYLSIPFDFIAIVDADKDLFLGEIILDDRIVYTDFYTMENYLTTDTVIDSLVKSYSTMNEKYIEGIILLEEIYKSIHPYILLCYKKAKEDWTIKLEDVGLETFGYKEKLKVEVEDLESHIRNECEKKSLTTIDIQWESIDEELSCEFNQDFDIRLITPGKRIFDALYYQIANRYPSFMKGRSKSIFKKDLSMYLVTDTYVETFLEKVKNSFEKVMNNGKESEEFNRQS